MQLELDNPYMSPQALDDASATVERKASLPRGLYYAVLWGAVVFPVPIFLAFLQVVFRPDLPSPKLPEATFEGIFITSMRMLTLPIFCGLIAIANYTPPVFYGYIRTFLFFGAAGMAGGTALSAISSSIGGPIYIQRSRSETLSGQQLLWNFGWFMTPLLIFCILLTSWRIVHSKQNPPD